MQAAVALEVGARRAYLPWMRIFISSLISNFAAERRAVRRAVETLRFEAVMAEDFGAQPSSPQVACLQGLRSSDWVVLVLGEDYGAVQPVSGLSATHEEYREARNTKPIFAFVQEGTSPGPEQAAFIAEVQAWQGGLFRGGFRDADDLQAAVIRALHDYTLTSATGPVDEQEIIARAVALLPQESRNTVEGPFIDIAVAGGPRQQLLRPVQMEAPDLADRLLQEALFGADRFFDRAAGTDSGLDGPDLVIAQQRGPSFRLGEDGSMTVRLLATEPRNRDVFGLPAIIEETVQQRIATALGFAAAQLEQIDRTERITHVAIAVRIAGSDYLGWRTRAEHAASPNSMTMGMGGDQRGPVTAFRRRASLRLDRTSLVEDLVVPLRRQWSSR
ncbi:DUF4062 domain-containing protein [Sphingomonas antarctica]|uniref:DUF4062 domain-containing protein n=1 Tax=Sphingomonas antarctica TaxID=2040274 RepID=UPI0039EC576F